MSRRDREIGQRNHSRRVRCAFRIVVIESRLRDQVDGINGQIVFGIHDPTHLAQLEQCFPNLISSWANGGKWNILPKLLETETSGASAPQANGTPNIFVLQTAAIPATVFRNVLRLTLVCA